MVLNKSLSNLLGLVILIFLLILNALHFRFNSIYPFYREIIAFLFIILISAGVTKGINNFIQFKIHRALLYLLAFPLLLIMCSFFDNGTQLYGNTSLEGVSENINGINPKVYTLRNAFLYLPMVIYFYIRGLNYREINFLALLLILIAPISIIDYYLMSITKVQDSGPEILFLQGGSIIAYNTYVPYLTYLILSGIYLYTQKSGLLKYIILISVIFTSLFCVISTSRQSVLFIILSFIAFGVANKSINYLKIILNIIFFFLIILIIFFYIQDTFELGDGLTTRYSSIMNFTSDETGRQQIMVQGLQMLEPLEWLFGAGLTSVLNSGPHNDYIRWLQRVGFPLMIFGFLPFFILLIKSLGYLKESSSNKNLTLFLLLGVFFTLFHSFFSYPREEVNQAFVVYLALSLWFGSFKNNLFYCKEVD